MSKKTTQEDTTPATDRERFQLVAMSLGRTVALTAQVVKLEHGHPHEDLAIKAMDEAWIALAGIVQDWAEGRD